MKIIYENKLEIFAKYLPCELYLVGGSVRNFLMGESKPLDYDLCSAIPVQEMISLLENFGGEVVARYDRTGTIVFKFDKIKYEYTCFRKDGYTAGGKHTPDDVEFTDDILEDALRRDFKCNAIYYDLKNQRLVDPLGGIEDIKNKVLDTVKSPKEVFSHDGLRLLRLARFTAELGFTPTKEVLDGAREYADNILDISVERIWAELGKILVADEKYPFSPKDGHYLGLKVLDDTRVLDRILPEIAKGRGIAQRQDFHTYDVLEHTLKSVLYAPKSVRLFAILHDVGKPLVFEKNGNFYEHEKEGVLLCKRILERLKGDKKTIQTAVILVGLHMADMDCKMRESKVRKLILENYKIIDLLLALKQADFSACKDDLSVCPTVIKWKEILEKMKEEGTPFNLKDLKITANDLIEIGYEGERIGRQMKRLLFLCGQYPEKNDREYLLEKARKDFEG